ncbi:MAG TPA: TA system VapC family ribonuclease toxin [Terriglobales bacterium]|nr:TA system VapC family ribonuclease toxin [Terriglobales bacterium]
MPRSTRLFLFPDINVWIALTYRAHIHYASARAWVESVPDDSELCFCRFTQLGFLRLLTTLSVMGKQVRSQAAAWETYDDWLKNGHAMYVEEPPSIDRIFRTLSRSPQASPKDWADSYLAAFAQAAAFHLVTFDQTLGRKTPGSILLTN